MTILEQQAELIEYFAMLADWQERYRLIIDLGRELPPLDDAYRTEEKRVKGCQSQVWLHAEYRDGLIHFTADSDAAIVRGLVAVLIKVFSAHTPAEILDAPTQFLDQLGLIEHLSQNRANGIMHMIQRIKFYAQSIQAENVA